MCNLKYEFRYSMSNGEHSKYKSGFKRWIKLNSDNALACLCLAMCLPIIAATAIFSPCYWCYGAVYSAWNNCQDKDI